MKGLAFLLTLTMVLALHATAPPASQFNGRVPVPPDSTGSYSFLVGGHFYGDGRTRTGLPAGTVLAGIERINATGAHLLMGTGDLFLDVARDLPRHREVLYDRLRMPVYNAVGNHDLDGDAYVDLLGPTTFAFDMGPDRFIVWDTERDDSRIVGDQLELLKLAVEDAEAGRLRHLMLFSHRPVWAEEDPRYADLFRQNTRSMGGPDLDEEVWPLLRRAAAHASVFWFAGSLGGSAPSSILWERPEPGIVLAMSAVRDAPRDALLLVQVEGRDVRPEAVPLALTRVGNVEKLDAAWWRDHQGRPAPFNWRLLPYRAWTIVSHRAFLWGAGTMLLLLWLLRRLLTR